METKSKCKCKTKYCKHYESDFDKFVKDNPPLPIEENGWEETFNKGFVWEKCCRDHYALFRVTNEADWDGHPYKDKYMGTRNLAHPDYVKGFIKVLLAKEKALTRTSTITEIEKGLMKKFDDLESNDPDKTTKNWCDYKFIRNNIRDYLDTLE